MTSKNATRNRGVQDDAADLVLAFDAARGAWRLPSRGGDPTRIAMAALPLPERCPAFDAMIAQLVGLERAARSVAGPAPALIEGPLLRRICEGWARTAARGERASSARRA